MRNEKLNREGHIPASQARIFWDEKEPKVVVLGDHQGYPDKLDYFNSGGACWTKWREECKSEDKAELYCLKAFYELVYIWEINPEVVDDALGCIIEYSSASKPHPAF